MAFFLGRGVIRAFFVAPIFVLLGAKNLPDSLPAVRSPHRRSGA
nr:MAG TPA: hypothetical protein [Caudoviricetes sp.]